LEPTDPNSLAEEVNAEK
jgi:hypothetical protein